MLTLEFDSELCCKSVYELLRADQEKDGDEEAASVVSDMSEFVLDTVPDAAFAVPKDAQTTTKRSGGICSWLFGGGKTEEPADAEKLMKVMKKTRGIVK